MEDAFTSQVPKQQRVVRVFVSSTFRDMHAEREELVKQIFPQLRKMCEERGITWAEVDLRWGITDEQKAEGKVLPLCLAEIERCRPFFIGLLGERYGWVPEEISQELIEREPWLAEHCEKSVTELEVIHGVLKNPEMANHACFYFRAPAYVEQVPTDQRADFIEQDTHTCQKLNELKDSIRASGLAVRENYPDPKTLGQMVLEDLTVAINQEFPLETVPEPLDREAAEHEAFAQSRSGVYIGRQEYFDRLDAHAPGDGPPLVILGESGSGKSALLANWALKYRRSHSEDLLIMHFIGASAYSADWAAMLRRIMGEFKRRFDIRQDIPDKPDELRSAFANWLHMAAVKGRVVLVLDALNQLEDQDQALDLVWLPPVIPSNVRLILSALPSRPLEELQKRDWPTLRITSLEVEERKQLIKEYLGQYRKTLASDQTEHIAVSEQGANPLYLRALLEELRVFGAHERLDERIEYYLAAATVPELYEKILERYEQDYDRERPGLVRDAVSLIWASRRGLSEAELLELLGKDGEPLPRAHWSPLYLAAEQSLVNRSGLIGFFHDYLREAVRQRYLPTESVQQQAHLCLADYFEAQELSPRKLDEYPYQLQHAKQLDALADALADLNFFNYAWEHNRKFEWMAYWRSLEGRSKPGPCYEATIHAKEKLEGKSLGVARLSHLVSGLLCDMALYRDALPFETRALLTREDILGPDHPDVATSLDRLAQIQYRRGRPSRNYWGNIMISLEIRERAFGPEHPDVAASINSVAMLHWGYNNYAEALPLLERALAIQERTLGPNHPDVAQTIITIASLYNKLGIRVRALPLLERALAIQERTLGLEHPNVVRLLTNVELLRRFKNGFDPIEQMHPWRFEGNYSEVLPLLERERETFERYLASNHPYLAECLYNIAIVYIAQCENAKALVLLERALVILNQSRAAQAPQGIGHFVLYWKERQQIEAAQADIYLKMGKRRKLLFNQLLLPLVSDIAGVIRSLVELYDDWIILAGVFAIMVSVCLKKFWWAVAGSIVIILGVLFYSFKWRRKLGLIGIGIAMLVVAILKLNGSLNEILFGNVGAWIIFVAIEFYLFGTMFDKIYQGLVEDEWDSSAIGYRVQNSTILKREEKLFSREGARKWPCSRALTILERQLGHDHPDLAKYLDSMGLVFKAQRELARALPLFERALAIREQALGRDHSDVATSLHNLASLYSEQGKYSKALPMIEEAYQLAVNHGLNTLAEQIKQILDSVRARLR